jgi:hypothetical protein
MHRFRVVLPLIAAAAMLNGAEFADRYHNRLQSLDAALPQSVCAARDTLREWMSLANEDDRAAMFREFRDYYLRSPQNTQRSFEKMVEPFGGDQADLSRRELVRVLEPWTNCGLKFENEEGMWNVATEPGGLAEFAANLPKDLADYVRFRAREDAQTIGGDAALALSWEQLRERLMRWETFARSHPWLTETRTEVQRAVSLLAELYFFGADNTRSYQLTSGRIERELRNSWRNLAAMNGDSYYKGLAVALLPGLAAHDGKLVREDRVVFEKFHFAEEFDNWWKSYQFSVNNKPR